MIAPPIRPGNGGCYEDCLYLPLEAQLFIFIIFLIMIILMIYYEVK